MALVFISHAGDDKPLVDELFDLLQTGCDLRRDFIFCSSVEGAGIQTGEDFARWIKGNMTDAQLVILLLTPNFYASKFCLAEMGAAWALEKDVFPLMSPDVARDPGVVFLGKQSARMDSTGLDDLRDRIAVFNPDAGKSTARWSIKKEAYLEQVAELLPTLPKPSAVDRSQLDQETERAAAAALLYKESETRNRELLEQVRVLEASKDAAEVQAIRTRFTPPLQRFDDRRSELRGKLRKLGRVEARALYAAVSEPWTPSSQTWEFYDSELKKAISSKWLSEVDVGNDNMAYIANKDHPKFANLFAELLELESAIQELPPEIRMEIETREQCLLEIENWQFWEESLLDFQLLQ